MGHKVKQRSVHCPPPPPLCAPGITFSSCKICFAEIFESFWSIYVILVSFEEGFEVELLRIFFQAYRIFVFCYNMVYNFAFFGLNLNLDNLHDEVKVVRPIFVL